MYTTQNWSVYPDTSIHKSHRVPFPNKILENSLYLANNGKLRRRLSTVLFGDHPHCFRGQGRMPNSNSWDQEYPHVPVKDAVSVPLSQYFDFDAAYNFLAQAEREQDGGKVLIHCCFQEISYSATRTCVDESSGPWCVPTTTSSSDAIWFTPTWASCPNWSRWNWICLAARVFEVVWRPGNKCHRNIIQERLWMISAVEF